jgi:tetratricopeptide (TPR) repeat protein
MGGYRHGESCRGLRGFLRVLLVCGFGLAVDSINPALAQDTLPTCSPAVARLVSLQGLIEIQRPGAVWLAVRRLDTVMCGGDKLRADKLSRALLFLQPETFVRVDQNTAISLNVDGEEIEVEFFAAELVAEMRSSQSRGAGYFITRFPKKFKIKTPHMNAAVEGTEFMVKLSGDATQLTVLEGKVASEAVATGNRQLVEAGQTLASGTAGSGAITAVVRPEDAVQWVLRYPPISDRSESTAIPGAEDCATRPANAQAECLTDRAEGLLGSGSVDEALSAIDAAIAANNVSSDAHALRAIIRLAKNDKVAAVESARRATAADAGNHRAWLALSYAQQAAFELESSLESASRAALLQPGSALAHSRVAELHFSLGDPRSAETAARTAVAAAPAESEAHAMLGFIRLAQVDTRAAQSDFLAAIERDSFAPLPRLGLGLTLIRDGRLTDGREQIEIAVALDPGNSLFRSYVGKAYYEENTRERDALAETQLRMAAEFDPKDPTPRLYEAIRLQSANQPVDALREIRQSIALNDNRAIYRSELKLDEDLAVRSASRGRIYRDLGFEQLAVLDGFASIESDPGDFSGHRLLADVYSNMPRHEIARVNELFTSQVLQPLNLTPIPPQLGESNLFILDVAGPADLSFNEFNPAFIRDGTATHVSATVGDYDTWGDDISFAALAGRWSLSAGQYHFETGGFRPNNDLDQDVYNAFVQFRQSDRTSMMLEARATRREQGDLRLLFDPGNFDPSVRQEEETESARLGAHHVIDTRSEWLASLVYQQAELQTELPPVLSAAADVDTWSGEFQYLRSWSGARAVGGLRATRRDQFEVQDLFGEVTETPFDFDNLSGYGYVYWQPTDDVSVTTGLTIDAIEGRAVDATEYNPKLGLSWKPVAGAQLRLAAMRSVQPDTYSRQDIQPRLEPTQVAGFNQLYAGTQGEVEWRYGIALDGDPAPGLSLGAEVTRRELEIPFLELGPPEQVTIARATENSARARLYWTPVSSFAIATDYRYDERSNTGAEVFTQQIAELHTHRITLGGRYFHPSGFSVDMAATFVDQQGRFIEFLPGPPFLGEVESGDRFWVLDAALKYRLPRRAGIIALFAENLTDKDFRFQDVDPENPEIIPERLISFKVTVAF